MGRKKKQNLLINLIILLLVGIGVFALLYFYGIPKSAQKEIPPTTINEEILNITDAPIISEEASNWSISAVYPKTGQDYIDSTVKTFIDGQLVDFKKIFSESGRPSDSESKNILKKSILIL